MNLSVAASSLLALSIASERLVEFVKSFVPWLNATSNSAFSERWRNFALRVLAVFSGMLTAWFAHEQIGGFVKQLAETPRWGYLALGLLVGGGSGFWNAALKYLGGLKDLKQEEVADKKMERMRGAFLMKRANLQEETLLLQDREGPQLGKLTPTQAETVVIGSIKATTGRTAVAENKLDDVDIHDDDDVLSLINTIVHNESHGVQKFGFKLKSSDLVSLKPSSTVSQTTQLVKKEADPK